MTSNDKNVYIREDVFNARMERLEAIFERNIDSVKSELRSEIQAVDTNVKVNSAKIEMLEHTFYWGFALMTLVIAVVAVFVPYLLKERKDKIQEKSTQPVLSEQRVQEMIQSALSKIGHVKRSEAQ